MSITRIQTSHVHQDAASTIQTTWSPGTTTGNLLVAAIVQSQGTILAPHAPSGWQTGPSKTSPNGTVTVTFYYYPNAPSRSSGSHDQWTGMSSTSDAVLCWAEYSGVATSTPLDQTASNNGTTAAETSGTTGTTAQASELLLGFLGCNHGGNYSSPINSFTIISQDNDASGNTDVSGALLENIVSATGTYQAGATESFANQWAAVIATFKGAAAGGALFVPANLSTGAGGPFFSNPLT